MLKSNRRYKSNTEEMSLVFEKAEIPINEIAFVKSHREKLVMHYFKIVGLIAKHYLKEATDKTEQLQGK
jgi:hypothetical protein